MNYSQSAKSEIVSLKEGADCCRLAFLSAVVHSAGSVLISDKGLKVEICSENSALLSKLSGIIRDFYAAMPLRAGKSRIEISGDAAMSMMYDCGIFMRDEEHTYVADGIAPFLVANECCKVNYLRGVFLGAGSISATRGYHLEFGLSNPVFAREFAALLESMDIPVKTILREKKIMVYAKGMESVCDCLALMGASAAVISLSSEVALRDVRREYNRINNCDVANIGKTVEAAVKQSEAIKTIMACPDYRLPEKLQQVADARMADPEASYSALAETLDLPRSTVKNRLSRIIQIAEQLQGDKK